MFLFSFQPPARSGRTVHRSQAWALVCIPGWQTCPQTQWPWASWASIGATAWLSIKQRMLFAQDNVQTSSCQTDDVLIGSIKAEIFGNAAVARCTDWARTELLLPFLNSQMWRVALFWINLLNAIPSGERCFNLFCFIKVSPDSASSLGTSEMPYALLGCNVSLWLNKKWILFFQVSLKICNKLERIFI